MLHTTYLVFMCLCAVNTPPYYIGKVWYSSTPFMLVCNYILFRVHIWYANTYIYYRVCYFYFCGMFVTHYVTYI